MGFEEGEEEDTDLRGCLSWLLRLVALLSLFRG